MPGFMIVLIFVRASLSESTQGTNRDKAITGVACLLGAISGGLGVTHGMDISSPEPTTALGWMAQHSWLVSLYLLYLSNLSNLSIRSPSPHCD